MPTLTETIDRFSEKLRVKVRADGLTLKEIAAAAGITNVALSYWLNGHKPLSPATLDRVAAAVRGGKI